MLNQVALVSETPQVTLDELALVSAAINKQVTRDFGPSWNVDASVDAFASLAHVPLGYWPVIVRDDIPFDAAGIHLDDNTGQPYSLVQIDTNWALTASHETLEMLADPSGNRTVAGNSIKPGQGRVNYLVEVCDPCESAVNGYSLNGVLLSDFYTPDFFAPVDAPGVRYSFTGAITQPRQVLEGGYISWHDPASNHVFQLFVVDGQRRFVDRGPRPGGFRTLREFTDRMAARQRRAVEHKGGPKGLMLTAAVPSSAGAPKRFEASVLDQSVAARAESIQRQVRRQLRRRKA